jgi:membrane protease YdiL (CAAX protease family)
MDGYATDANGVTWTADGRWWWDGYAWRPGFAGRPPEPPLDQAVTRDRADGRRWGLAALGALLWLVGLQLLLTLVSGSIHAGAMGGALIGLALEASIGGVVLLAMRWAGIPVSSLSIGHLRPRDAGTIVGWSLLGYGARIAAAVVPVVAIPALRHGFAPNVPALRHFSPLVIVTLVITAAVVAPICEELMFRGLLLRALMRRLPFPAATALSSLAFGIGHAYEEPSLGGAVLITTTLAAFAVVQCLLVRRTNRLILPMMLHGIANSVSLVAAALA